jgi:hypothetical protein
MCLCPVSTDSTDFTGALFSPQQYSLPALRLVVHGMLTFDVPVQACPTPARALSLPQRPQMRPMVTSTLRSSSAPTWRRFSPSTTCAPDLAALCLIPDLHAHARPAWRGPEPSRCWELWQKQQQLISMAMRVTLSSPFCQTGGPLLQRAQAHQLQDLPRTLWRVRILAQRGWQHQGHSVLDRRQCRRALWLACEMLVCAADCMSIDSLALCCGRPQPGQPCQAAD